MIDRCYARQLVLLAAFLWCLPGMTGEPTSGDGQMQGTAPVTRGDGRALPKPVGNTVLVEPQNAKPRHGSVDAERDQAWDASIRESVKVLEVQRRRLVSHRISKRERQRLQQALSGMRSEIANRIIARAQDEYRFVPSIPRIGRAVKILERYQTFDNQKRAIHTTLTKFKRIRAALIQQREKSARDAFLFARDKAWTQAIKALDEATLLDPATMERQVVRTDQGTGNAVTTKVTLGDKRNLWVVARDEYFRDAIEQALAAKDMAGLGKLLDDLRADPTAAGTFVTEMEQSATKLGREIAVGRIAKEVETSRYFTAYRLLQDNQEIADDPIVTKITDEGAAYYIKEAKAALASKQPGRAYLAAVKALTLKPDSAAGFELHKRARDTVLKSLTVQIAISGFDSPKNEANAGTQLADSLIATLVEKLPFGIQILERSKIDLLLEEKGKRLKDLSRLVNAKYFIIGNVYKLDVEHQRSEREATAIVHLGETAKGKTGNAQVVKYRLGEEKMSGLMTASVRFFDADKGAVSYARDFRVTKSAVDSFRDAVAAAKIKDDPLKLPTDNEMKEDLRVEMVQQVSKVVMSLFEKRQWRFWEKAKASLARREKANAIEMLAQGYLYCISDTERVSRYDKWFLLIQKKALFELTENSQTKR